MGFLGRWEIDDLLTFPANTHSVATGAATDADSVPTYRVYEDETGTAILTGSMAKLDDAGTTGFYSEQITLSAANGFEVGKCYTIYVSATVGSVVGTMAYTFQVEAALALASALATVQADTDDIQTRLPAALVSGRMDSSVGAMATDVLGSAALNATAVTEIQSGLATSAAIVTLQTAVDDIPTNAELATSQAAADDTTLAAIAALNNISATGVRTAIGLASANLDTQLDALPTNAELTTALGTADDATLAAIAALNNLSAAQVKTQADQALADYDAPTHTELTAELATADDATLAQIALVKAKTDNLPTDPADASDITGAFAVIAAAIAALSIPSAATIAAAVWTYGTRSLTSFGTLVADIWAAVTRTLTSAGGGSLTAADVWAYATRTITGGGGSAADIWGYSTRTLTQTAQQVADSMGASGDLHIIRAVTFSATLTGLNLPAGWSKLFMTIKAYAGMPDSMAAAQVIVSATPDAEDGLLIVGQAAATDAAQGSLVVAGDSVAIRLEDDCTALMTSGAFVYDLKVLIGADSTAVLLAAGSVTVASTPTEQI